MINYEDFSKVEIKIGEIKSAQKIEKSDKLFLLSVDFGPQASVVTEDSVEDADVAKERDIRTVVSGIAPYFEDAGQLVGVTCAFVTNLEPRPLMGYESQAMILGARRGDTFALLQPSAHTTPGTVVG